MAASAAMAILVLVVAFVIWIDTELEEG